MKTGFIYIWHDKRRKMYYIGYHLGTEDDGYICSSNRMRDAFRRRPKDFKRRILKRGIPRDQLLDEEYKWLSLIKDEELGKKYYNHSKRHFGHWALDENILSISQKISKKMKGRKLSNAHKTKISKHHKGKRTHEWSIESREKLRIANLGRKDSEEIIEKRRLSNIKKGHKRKITKCFICGITGPVNSIGRNHNNNCGKKRKMPENVKFALAKSKGKI